MINVYIKHPGHPPFACLVQNTLKALQKLVSGRIETIPIFEDLIILCNEEGRLLDLPYNCECCGIDFVGTIVLVGVDGEEFDSVPATREQLIKLFPKLWEVPA